MSWEYTTHTNTHTHQSSGPDGSTMCRQRWELLGYRRHLLRRWWRLWRSERVWVCESVNCATLQRWFTTWMRLWQLCKVTVSFIIKSGVARGTRAVCEPIHTPDRFLMPWANTDIISSYFSFSRTLFHLVRLWRFVCKHLFVTDGFERSDSEGVPTGMWGLEIHEKCEA